MANTMVDESIWRDEVWKAVYFLVLSGRKFTSDDVHDLVKVEAPYPGAWSTIWEFTSNLQRELPDQARRSKRPAAKGHWISVRVGRIEVIQKESMRPDLPAYDPHFRQMIGSCDWCKAPRYDTLYQYCESLCEGCSDHADFMDECAADDYQ